MKRLGVPLAAGVVLFSIATVAVGSSEEPLYAFSLDRVDGAAVHLLCDRGCSWKTVSYAGGTFIVSVDGVQTAVAAGEDAETPMLTLQLDESSAGLVVTCHATQCRLAGPAHSRMKSQDLKHGGSTTVPVVSGFKFEVLK